MCWWPSQHEPSARDTIGADVKSKLTSRAPVTTPARSKGAGARVLALGRSKLAQTVRLRLISCKLRFQGGRMSYVRYRILTTADSLPKAT